MRVRSFLVPAALGLTALLAASCGTTSTISQPTAVAIAPALHPNPVPAAIAPYVSQDTFDQLSAQHQAMLRSIAEDPTKVFGMSTCFAEGTPDATVQAFHAVLNGFQPRFNQPARWNATARNPGGGALGSPTIVTYSFVPDGTSINGFNGEPAAPSNLFAYLRGIYGTDTAWQAHYHAIFQRWGQLCGVTYVHEPNDDGVAINSASGVAGVRGDVRLSGHYIDGPSGVLAYNFYPQSGDMVLDTGDNYFNNTGSNSLRLRNVLAHEHGHGMGQAHVCPIAQTKLMEPFVSTAYDGPRHDDIRNAQQAYGDIFEPNNTAATATVLGTLSLGTPISVGAVPAPAIPLGSVASININNDSDYYKISVNQLTYLTVTATPIGQTYEDAQQACSDSTGSCCSGTFTDSLRMANLNIQVIGSNGVTVLATAATQPAGEVEVASNIELPAPGDYYIRIYAGNTPSQVQLYTLNIAGAGTGINVDLPSGAPTRVDPGVPTTFPVTITPFAQTITQARIFYRPGNGTFSSMPLVNVGGNNWTATLPAFDCTASPNFYIQVNGSSGTISRSPANAPTSVHSAFVGDQVVVFSDDFETNRGWVVTNDPTLTSGAWQRADPVGTAAQPENDVSDPGTLCYVTGAAGGAVGADDIDGGATYLTSPTFSLADTSGGIISYWRWYSNTQGDNPASDTMVISISSDNGANWTTIETLGPTTNNNGGWFQSNIDLAAFPAVARTATMKLRFTASDLGAGSVVEAAVDEVVVFARACTPPSGACGTSDFDGDGDFGTDADIEAFFACLAGQCCPTCFAGGADFNGDGDTGTDADIEAFFRVLAGGNC